MFEVSQCEFCNGFRKKLFISDVAFPIPLPYNGYFTNCLESLKHDGSIARLQFVLTMRSQEIETDIETNTIATALSATGVSVQY